MHTVDTFCFPLFLVFNVFEAWASLELWNYQFEEKNMVGSQSYNVLFSCPMSLREIGNAHSYIFINFYL